MDITCYACAGRKEVLGLGGMKKKCLHCAGTGYIKKQEKAEEKEGFIDSRIENTHEESRIKTIKKKLGRPKKVQ